MKNIHLNRRCSAAGRGLTLAEVLVAMVIIGIAIAALVGANGAFTKVNGAAVDLSTAEFLIEQIRELTAALPVIDPESGFATFGPEPGEGTIAAWDDLDDFDGASICPPVDISLATLAEFGSFTQQITVENVDPTALETPVPDHGSDFVRVTVSIVRNGRPVSSASWIRTRY